MLFLRGLIMAFGDLNRGVIGLLCTGGAAAIGDLLFENLRHARDDIRMFSLHVLRFADVIAQIVELHIGQALLLRVGIAGLAPAAAAGT